jgi:hypothetical protein
VSKNGAVGGRAYVGVAFEWRRWRQHLHQRKGARERGEHGAREADDELLAASERRGHSAGEVGQPMDKVEGDVGGVGVSLRKEPVQAEMTNASAVARQQPFAIATIRHCSHSPQQG